jgi:hypothetical protein
MGDLPGLRGKSVRADPGVAGELTRPKTSFNPDEGRGANLDSERVVGAVYQRPAGTTILPISCVKPRMCC